MGAAFMARSKSSLSSTPFSFLTSARFGTSPSVSSAEYWAGIFLALQT
jgi:hypothetical protein